MGPALTASLVARAALGKPCSRAVSSLIDEDIHEAYLEIVDRERRLVVTVIEVLSPANKVAGSRGRASFEQKRKEVMSSPSHWVEIDLLRSGVAMTALETVPPCEYRVHVSEVGRRRKGLVRPIRLSQKLPAVPIPLRAEDPSVRLDLQAVLDATYDRGAYDLVVDYVSDPAPPLPPDWADWARQLLQRKGLRTS